MILKKNTSLNLFFIIISIIILSIVNYMEIFKDIQPCKLCIYQRYPCYLAIFLGIFFFLIKNQKLKKNIFLLYILIFFSSFIMALHHLGIENNLWNSITSCEDNSKNLSNNNLKDYLLNKEYVSCEDVAFKFLGISLAGFNLIISLILLILSFAGNKRFRH